MINGILDSNQKIVSNGLVLNLDAAQKRSYPTSGTAWTDLSGNANNGTLTNGPTFDSGNGGSISFDGTNDYVNFGNPSSLNFTGSMTCSCWFYRESSATTNLRILSKGGGGASTTENGFSFFGSNTNISWSLTNNAVRTIINTGDILNIQTWYNIVGVCDKTTNTSTLYLNGSLITSASLNNTGTMAGTLSFNIGRNSASTGSLYWVGNVSSTLIYNRAISATEVSQNYNAIKSRFGL
jgi:hypothetical protein